MGRRCRGQLCPARGRPLSGRVRGEGSAGTTMRRAGRGGAASARGAARGAPPEKARIVCGRTACPLWRGAVGSPEARGGVCMGVWGVLAPAGMRCGEGVLVAALCQSCPGARCTGRVGVASRQPVVGRSCGPGARPSHLRLRLSECPRCSGGASTCGAAGQPGSPSPFHFGSIRAPRNVSC